MPATAAAVKLQTKLACGKTDSDYLKSPWYSTVASAKFLKFLDLEWFYANVNVSKTPKTALSEYRFCMKRFRLPTRSVYIAKIYGSKRQSEATSGTISESFRRSNWKWKEKCFEYAYRQRWWSHVWPSAKFESQSASVPLWWHTTIKITQESKTRQLGYLSCRKLVEAFHGCMLQRWSKKSHDIYNRYRKGKWFDKCLKTNHRKSSNNNLNVDEMSTAQKEPTALNHYNRKQLTDCCYYARNRP